MLRVTPGRLDFTAGLDLLEEELRFLLGSSVLQPPKPMRGSTWINEFGRISAETSGQPGKVTLWGYQREPADVICGNGHDQITVMKGTRVGYSNLVKQCIAFNLVHEATSVFVVQPTDREAENFWRQELAPMFRDIKELAALRRRPVRGEPADTISDIMLSNHGMLYLRGAESDANLRGKAARRRYGDEFDAPGWRPKAKGDGNKLDLMRARGEGFADGCDVVGSTPLDVDTSNVYAEWLRSDQRHLNFTCPHCGGFQRLVWGGRKEGRGIWYDLVPGTQRVARVYYKCEHGGCEIDESKKFEMVEGGVWVPDRPDVERHAGYHMWQGMSYHPKASWTRIVQRWLDAQGDPAKLKVFWNNTLGLPWTPIEGKTISASSLAERCEPYPAACPDDVVVITMGGDTQKGSEDQSLVGAAKERVEISVWGWGRGKECWLLGHWILDQHEPWSDECAAQVDAILKRPFTKRNGTELFVQAAAFDIGGGFGDQVKNFCANRPRRNLWPVKGANIPKGTRRGFIWPKAASKAAKAARTQWFMLDTQLAKDQLEVTMKRGGRGPGTVHFPSWCAQTDFFEGLTAEHKTFIKANGGWHWDHKNKKANSGEEWDAWVYALSALEGLQVSDRKWTNLNVAADKAGVAAYVPPHDPETGELIEEPLVTVHDVGPDRSAQAEEHHDVVQIDIAHAVTAAETAAAVPLPKPPPAEALPPPPGAPPRKVRAPIRRAGGGLMRSSW